MDDSLPLVSVIINNYNYSSYLQECLESVIHQQYRNTEIIVVDDGSTDGSQLILSQYSHQITLALKENGGQASALNLGYLLSNGSWILFLDSDDFLLPDALAKLAELTQKYPCAAKVHAPLLVLDQAANKLEGRVPAQSLSAGNLESTILKYGPESYVCPPTSGNIWNRHFLDEILPIPEQHYRTSADAYLFTLVPLFGDILKLDQAIGVYRVHGQNQYWQKSISYQTLRRDSYRFKHRTLALARYSKQLGKPTEAKVWRLNNRYYLAKILLLRKLKHRSLPHHFLIACLRSSWIAPIPFPKRIAWVLWFVSLWFA
jgi:glycosyltransferase involved in cell wall biosynthesis